MLGGKSLDTFVSQLSNRLRRVGGTYSIPRDSGAKTALSRVFAYLLLRKSSVCIYVSGWLEVRADDDEAIKEFATELEKYGIPLLTR
jgi:hypothetical protein